MRLYTLVNSLKFILLVFLIVALGPYLSVYANNMAPNQCAKLFEVQKQSFAKFINQKVKLLQDEQNQNIEAQRLAEERFKEEEHQRKELVKALDPVTQSRKIQFITIKPRSFKMGVSKNAVKVHITVPYDIMDAKMTQMMYAQLMLLMGIEATELVFPSYYRDGKNSIPYIHNESEIQMRPDDPVTDVSWEFIDEIFLPKLNELSQTDDPKIQDRLKILIPDHQKGDVYDFVTEAQFENVAKLSITSSGDSIDAMIKRKDYKTLKRHAVFAQNSDFIKGTHPVNASFPLYIDGQKIYLRGNAWEWMKDHWNGRAPLIGRQDPLSTVGEFRLLRGGGWAQPASSLHSAYRSSAPPSVGDENQSFRLARISRGGSPMNLGSAP